MATDFNPTMIVVSSAGIFCSFCQLQLTTKGAAKLHIERKHLIPRFLIECSMCPKVFRNKMNFVDHVGKYHGKRGERNLLKNYGIMVPNELFS